MLSVRRYIHACTTKRDSPPWKLFAVVESGLSLFVVWFCSLFVGDMGTEWTQDLLMTFPGVSEVHPSKRMGDHIWVMTILMTAPPLL